MARPGSSDADGANSEQPFSELITRWLEEGDRLSEAGELAPDPTPPVGGAAGRGSSARVRGPTSARAHRRARRQAIGALATLLVLGAVALAVVVSRPTPSPPQAAVIPTVEVPRAEAALPRPSPPAAAVAAAPAPADEPPVRPSVPAIADEPPMPPSSGPAVADEPPLRPSPPAVAAAQPAPRSAPVVVDEPPLRPSAPAVADEPPARPSAPAVAAGQPARPSAPAVADEPPTPPSAPAVAATPRTRPSAPAVADEPPLRPSAPAVAATPPARPPAPAVAAAPLVQPTAPAVAAALPARPSAPAVAVAPPAPRAVPRPLPAAVVTSPGASLEECKTALRKERARDAVTACGLVVAAEPDSAAAIVLLAHADLLADRTGETLRLARRAATIDPRNAEAQLLIGNVEQLNGRMRAARAAYESYLALAPGGAHAAEVRSILRRALR